MTDRKLTKLDELLDKPIAKPAPPKHEYVKNGASLTQWRDDRSVEEAA